VRSGPAGRQEGLNVLLTALQFNFAQSHQTNQKCMESPAILCAEGGRPCTLAGPL
jgi:hypothetical protein